MSEILANPLWLQIPLAAMVALVVALFLYFIDRWLKAEREARAKDSEQFRLWMSGQLEAERKLREVESTKMQNFMASSQNQFIEFMKYQQDEYSKHFQTISEELQEASKQLSGLTTIVTAHDIRSQEARNSARNNGRGG